MPPRARSVPGNPGRPSILAAARENARAPPASRRRPHRGDRRAPGRPRARPAHDVVAARVSAHRVPRGRAPGVALPPLARARRNADAGGGRAGLRLALRPQALECGMLWALLGALLAFGVDAPAAASIALAGAGLVLLVSLVETSHAIAYGDELTGLPSRRALTETLAGLQGAYTIAMVDIDHFKVFNDTYGHDAGDQLLRMIGVRLAEVGGGGRPFRYGGEEFAVIFSATPLDDALPHIEMLRQSIESTGFGLRAADRSRRRDGAPRVARPTRRVSVSVSIGVAEAGRSATPGHAVLDAA